MANGRFDLGEWNCITTRCFLFLFRGQQDSSPYSFGWGPDLSLSEKMVPEFFIKVGTQAITAKPPKQLLWIFLQGKNNHEACINSLSNGFISSHPLITFVSDLQRNCIFQKFFSPKFLPPNRCIGRVNSGGKPLFFHPLFSYSGEESWKLPLIGV